MSELIRSFMAPLAHGCLVLRGIDAQHDHSDWDPDASPVDVGDESIMFAARFMVEGPVHVEVWKGEPPSRLPHTIHDGNLSRPRGVLVVHDPNDEVRMEFRGEGAVRIDVDDVESAERVSIVLANPTAET